jgi:hypothetical protein
VKKHFFTTLLFVALSAPFANALAATWYHVEIMAFEYLAPQYVDGEQWSVEVGELELQDVLELIEDVPEFDDEPEFADNDETQTASPMAFKALAEKEFVLSDLASKLSRSADHRVLTHVAWRQPKFSNRNARSVHIKHPIVEEDFAAVVTDSAGGELGADAPIDFMAGEIGSAPQPVVEGVLRVRSGQQLHVDVDFLYRRELMPTRLTEMRRIKLREVHYFDHPLFGLLVEITPYVFGVDLPGAEIDDLPVAD